MGDAAAVPVPDADPVPVTADELPIPLSPGTALLLLAFAPLPLFLGWRILRIVLGIAGGIAWAVLSWTYAPHLFGSMADGLRLGAAIGGFAIGFSLGLWCCQLHAALAGAYIGAVAAGGAAALALTAEASTVVAGLGASLGLILGWVAAPYWYAIMTAVIGGIMVYSATLALFAGRSEAPTTALAAAGAATLCGIVVQIGTIIRRRTMGSG